MGEMPYPRIEINPAHCGIYKEYHDKRGQRHIMDSPYVVRRKVRSQGDRLFITLQGQDIEVRRNHAPSGERTVMYETFRT